MSDPTPGEPAVPGLTATPAADLPAVKRTQRPHPLTPLIRGWVVLLALLFGLAREVLSWFTEQRPLPPLHFLVAGVAAIALISIAIGFFSWLTTRFLIDADELRIETGILLRKSRRIAFDKVASIDVLQPLAARIFGLAELEIDIGSTDRVKLRYLHRAQAYSLRDYLLSRARGHRAELAAEREDGLRLDDLGVEDQLLVRIPPGQLIIGAITSNEFLWLMVSIVVTLVAALIAAPTLGGFFLVLALGVSALSGVGGFVLRRVTGQFNFTLSTRPAGLRISRGLTSLTSQSVPPRRIQLVRLSQSLLWRRFGWYRAEVDVLGVGLHNEEGTRASVSSVLLPVASAAEVELALVHLWPGVDWTTVALEPAPPRARWLHPLSAPFLAWGHDDSLMISRHGWLERRWDLVPHARVQSVRVNQRLISRVFHLADLGVHPATGRLTPHAKGLDADRALQAVADLSHRAGEHHRDLTVAVNEQRPIPASTAPDSERPSDS